MKKILLSLLTILAPFVINAQTDAAAAAPSVPLDEEGIIRYIEVVNETGTADELFKRCVKWINKEYKNPSTVTPTRDAVTGKIVVRHIFRLQNTLETGTVTEVGDVAYDLNIQFKEGRYRAELTSFVYKKASKFPAENWLATGTHPNPEYISQLNEFALGLLESLKEGMKPEKVHKAEEW